MVLVAVCVVVVVVEGWFGVGILVGGVRTEG